MVRGLNKGLCWTCTLLAAGWNVVSWVCDFSLSQPQCSSTPQLTPDAAQGVIFFSNTLQRVRLLAKSGWPHLMTATHTHAVNSASMAI